MERDSSTDKSSFDKSLFDDEFDDSFEVDEKATKLLPDDLDTILNPDILGEGVNHKKNTAPRVSKAALMDQLIAAIDSVSKREMDKLNLEPYFSIMPVLPSSNYPGLKRIPTDKRMRHMNVDPKVIVRVILDHMNGFQVFRTIETPLIPDSIKQDVLEANNMYSNSNVYAAQYWSLENTLKDLKKWSKGTEVNGWQNLFRLHLQEKFNYIPDVLDRAFKYLSALVVFYFYAAVYYGDLGYTDLRSYWTNYTLEERQGVPKLASVSEGPDEFIYKYKRVSRNKTKRLITNEDEEGGLGIERHIEKSEEPVVLTPAIRNVTRRSDKILNTIQYSYICLSLIGEFKKIIVSNLVSQEYGILVNNLDRMTEWRARAIAAVGFVVTKIHPDDNTDLARMVRDIKSALDYIKGEK